MMMEDREEWRRGERVSCGIGRLGFRERAVCHVCEAIAAARYWCTPVGFKVLAAKQTCEHRTSPAKKLVSVRVALLHRRDHT